MRWYEEHGYIANRAGGKRVDARPRRHRGHNENTGLHSRSKLNLRRGARCEKFRAVSGVTLKFIARRLARRTLSSC